MYDGGRTANRRFCRLFMKIGETCRHQDLAVKVLRNL